MPRFIIRYMYLHTLKKLGYIKIMKSILMIIIVLSTGWLYGQIVGTNLAPNPEHIAAIIWRVDQINAEIAQRNAELLKLPPKTNELGEVIEVKTNRFITYQEYYNERILKPALRWHDNALNELVNKYKASQNPVDTNDLIKSFIQADPTTKSNIINILKGTINNKKTTPLNP